MLFFFQRYAKNKKKKLFSLAERISTVVGRSKMEAERRRSRSVSVSSAFVAADLSRRRTFARERDPEDEVRELEKRAPHRLGNGGRSVC
jgi:hypothetical protein